VVSASTAFFSYLIAHRFDSFVSTEVWQNKREFNDSAVEREGNGMVASVGWYTPKFAVEADVSITHYLGLVGDANRQK
jgi:hypothetical protein